MSNLKFVVFLFMIISIVNANKNFLDKLRLHDECGISPRENLKALSKKLGIFKFCLF